MSNPTVVQKKICMLGDFAVGKTSLVRQFVYDLFDDRYLSTLGVKVSRKSLNLTQGTDQKTLNLILWDLSGAAEFNQMQSSYYRGAAGAVMVCDLTRVNTLYNLAGHITAFQRVNPITKIIVVANKNDLRDEAQFGEDELAKFAASYGFPHFTSSAKTDDNVDLLFDTMGRLILWGVTTRE